MKLCSITTGLMLIIGTMACQEFAACQNVNQQDNMVNLLHNDLDSINYFLTELQDGEFLISREEIGLITNDLMHINKALNALSSNTNKEELLKKASALQEEFEAAQRKKKAQAIEQQLVKEYILSFNKVLKSRKNTHIKKAFDNQQIVVLTSQPSIHKQEMRAVPVSPSYTEKSSPSLPPSFATKSIPNFIQGKENIQPASQKSHFKQEYKVTIENKTNTTMTFCFGNGSKDLQEIPVEPNSHITVSRDAIGNYAWYRINSLWSSSNHYITERIAQNSPQTITISHAFLKGYYHTVTQDQTA